MTDNTIGLKEHPVVSPEDWQTARIALLAKEKEFNRLRDELSRQRRQLPWEKVEQTYIFDGPEGNESLSDLFGNKSQLMIYHFMFEPEDEEGCPLCSFWAEHFDGVGVHIQHRDVSFVAISRAPLEKLEAYKKRMGWKFKWLSSYNNRFNYDFHVNFTPEQAKNGTIVYNYRKLDTQQLDWQGLSVFYKDEGGAVFHTYSTYMRGIDMLNGTYNFLDLAPKGRGEDGHDFPMDWVNYKDRYED